MAQNIKETTQLAAEVAMKLSGVQVRGEVGTAIAIVNGMQEILKVYGTEMDYEQNKELLDNIVEAANVVSRTMQVEIAKKALKDHKSAGELATKIKGAKRNNVIVGINGKMDFVSIEIEGDDSKQAFLDDLVKALNGAYKKSFLVAADKLDEIAK